MKYLKKYEKIKKPKVDFKVGDYVTPIESTGFDPEMDLIEGVIYKIIRIYSNEGDKNIDFQSTNNPYHVCDVQFENGRISKLWYLKRFKLAILTPEEIEYLELK